MSAHITKVREWYITNMMFSNRNIRCYKSAVVRFKNASLSLRERSRQGEGTATGDTSTYHYGKNHAILMPILIRRHVLMYIEGTSSFSRQVAWPDSRPGHAKGLRGSETLGRFRSVECRQYAV